MHVMTLKNKTSKYRVEIHMLNPREHFPTFGGHRNGLTVGKTASLITREYHEGGLRSDIEYNIHDPKIWAWIAERINDPESPMVAETPHTLDAPKKAEL